MTVVAGDILRTSVNFTLGNGELHQNVYHHVRTGLGVLDDATHLSILEAWVEAMYGELITQIDAGVTEQVCSVDIVEWVTDKWEIVENVGTFLPTIAFAAAGEALPSQISCFIVFKTERPKTVGRKFLFAFTEAESDQGILTAGTVTDVVAFADDAVNQVTLQLGDYLVPGVVRTGIDDWKGFTSAVVTDLLGTQRRRRPGYGA